MRRVMPARLIALLLTIVLSAALSACGGSGGGGSGGAGSGSGSSAGATNTTGAGHGGAQRLETLNATLTWQAPFSRENGTTLAMGEIKQYIVRYGTQPDIDTMEKELIVEDGQAMEAEITGLSEGTWYFAMRTVDQNGLESAWSEVASTAVSY